jgi:hypothetical protein
VHHRSFDEENTQAYYTAAKSLKSRGCIIKLFMAVINSVP